MTTTQTAMPGQVWIAKVDGREVRALIETASSFTGRCAATLLDGSYRTMHFAVASFVRREMP